MNKQGKIFGKINIIDLLAILVVVVAVVGIAIRFTSSASKNVTNKTEFSYVVELDDVRIYTVEALQKKGITTDKQGNVLGEITDVKYEPKTEQVILENGESKMVEKPERYTVYVTLKGNGKEASDAYFVGENTELSAGANIKMFTKYANCTGKVFKVEKK